MHEAVILSACRTPLGRFLGALSRLNAADLAAAVFAPAVARAGVSATEVDEVILGHVLAAGAGMAPARQAALRAGLPDSVACLTINKVCGSGLKAVALAAQAIRAGDAHVVLAGGTESMSNAPHLLRDLRRGVPFGAAKLEDSISSEGLECAFEKWPMGCAAEHIAARFKIPRAEQDRFALQSHARACAAADAGRFDAEIIPIQLPGKDGASFKLTRDEGPRANSSLDKLAALKPVFAPQGIVSAGNSSPLSDGAAALVLAEAAWATARGLKPLAKILATATSGVAPKEIFHAPVLAIPAAVARAGLKMSEIGLFELNEAFAAQALANIQELRLDEARVNINGGALALGHPLGASGARCLVTLLHALQSRGERYGVAALCLGGGNAIAMVVERT